VAVLLKEEIKDQKRKREAQKTTERKGVPGTLQHSFSIASVYLQYR
jgi:hypothetical protein